MSEDDIGTYYYRKGVTIMGDTGCTVYYHIVFIYFHSCWVMGGVMEHRLFWEYSGDPFVGRCAASFNQPEQYFALSPPHFDCSKMNEVDQAVMNMKVDLWFEFRIIYFEYLSS